MCERCEVNEASKNGGEKAGIHNSFALPALYHLGLDGAFVVCIFGILGMDGMWTTDGRIRLQVWSIAWLGVFHLRSSAEHNPDLSHTLLDFSALVYPF